MARLNFKLHSTTFNNSQPKPNSPNPATDPRNITAPLVDIDMQQFEAMRRLPAMTPTAVETMLSQLRNRGFACVSLQQNHCPWIQDALQAATSQDAASLGEFRFPPLEGPIVYTDSRRLAFRALFEVATNCFSGILHHINCSELSMRDDGVCQSSSSLQQKIKIYTSALQQLHDNKESSDDFELFRHNINEPFEHDGQPFSQSFFNLFNYNHGSLNSHVDRSLLTVIYSNVPNHEDVVDIATAIRCDQHPSNHNSYQRKSSLWIKDNTQTWHNADQAVQPNEAIVMVGEDLMSSNNENEESSIASVLGLYAAEHAVRVDPAGLRIERSHFRKDPRCTEDIANRCSAAMILRHEVTI